MAKLPIWRSTGSWRAPKIARLHATCYPLMCSMLVLLCLREGEEASQRFGLLHEYILHPCTSGQRCEGALLLPRVPSSSWLTTGLLSTLVHGGPSASCTRLLRLQVLRTGGTNLQDCACTAGYQPTRYICAELQRQILRFGLLSPAAQVLRHKQLRWKRDPSPCYAPRILRQNAKVADSASKENQV